MIIFAYTIQIFVQNFNIEKEIKDLKQTQYILSGDTYWTKNYYEPFLKTEYAKMIFKHRAWILQDKEILIKISYIDKEKEIIDKKEKKIYNEDTQTLSCKDFVLSLYKKYLSFN
jgi:hypothetical protein